MIDISKVQFDEKGLIPAVIQESGTGLVLMLAYMNRESLERTLEKGETHFWSRSRKQLWHKGETSGNTQRVVSIAVDCDGDTLLLEVQQTGNACHTGAHSCFFEKVLEPEHPVQQLGDVMSRLEQVIATRKREMPVGSYTTYLFESGLDKILKKVGEEAAETIIAAKNHARAEITWEVADLLYHLLVLLEHEGVHTPEIAAELIKREGKRRAPK